MSGFTGNDKQVEILKALRKRNDDGSLLDTQQIIAALSYKPTRAALKSSLKVLESHGMIVPAGLRHRDGQKRAIWNLSATGFNFLREVA